MSYPSSQWELPTTQGPGETETEIPVRRSTDKLISIRDIRKLFSLGRTAVYELTHRPGFPEPVKLSRRCYRWWADDVTAFAESMRSERASPKRRGNTQRTLNYTTKSQRSTSLRIAGKMRFARSPAGNRSERSSASPGETK